MMMVRWSWNYALCAQTLDNQMSFAKNCHHLTHIAHTFIHSWNVGNGQMGKWCTMQCKTIMQYPINHETGIYLSWLCVTYASQYLHKQMHSHLIELQMCSKKINQGKEIASEWVSELTKVMKMRKKYGNRIKK